MVIIYQSIGKVYQKAVPNLHVSILQLGVVLDLDKSGFKCWLAVGGKM